MAADRPRRSEEALREVPVADPEREEGATKRRARPEREEINSIRARRVRVAAGDEPQRAAISPTAKKEPDPKAAPAPPLASAGKPAAASDSAPNPWALPQSVRDRFIQDKRRFYFPDGAAAFRDHGKRLTTASENTEVIHSLIDIARTRGWEEITVDGTKTFRQEAWRQGRLAGLDVRGYRPTKGERAAVVRALARQADGAQMELKVAEGGFESNAAERESSTSPGASKTRGTRGPRDLIVGKLIDHGRQSYRFDPRESMSYFIELATDEGKRTIWGKDLERAMKQSLTQPQIGDEIAMRRTGADQVTVQRRDRDADGRVIAEREVGASRNRWVVEKHEFFEARAAAAGVLRDPNVDRRQAVRQHPELVGTYLQLHAAQLAARRIRDPEDREKFVALVRAALADSVARGDPLQPVRLRDRAGRVPERKPPEREPGPARA